MSAAPYRRSAVHVDPPPPGPFSTAVTAGGLVFVSGILATDESGRLAGGDLESQVRNCFGRLRQVVEAAGSSMAQVVNVNVFLKDPADFARMNAVYREFFSDRAPTRTTVAAGLFGGALVEIEAVAVPLGAPREVMHPEGWMKSPRPYSLICRAGGLTYFAGLVSRRGQDDVVVPGGVAAQTRTILENARVLLRTAGLGFDDVVQARVFITDMKDFGEMNEVYGEFFTAPPPARATIAAALMGPDARVEISLVGKAPM